MTRLSPARSHRRGRIGIVAALLGWLVFVAAPGRSLAQAPPGDAPDSLANVAPDSVASPAPAPEPVGNTVASTDDLAPTSAAPWNPSRAVGFHETWEQALNAPLTLASLPIRLLGAGLEAGILREQEDRWIPRVMFFFGVGTPLGIYLRPAQLGERSGMGAGVEYRPPQLHGWLRAGIDASTRGYNTTRVELGPRLAALRYEQAWRPREPYFGEGMDSREEDASSYATSSQLAEVRLRLRRGTTWRREIGAWAGERRLVASHGREAKRSSLEIVHPGVAPQALGVDQDHIVTGLRLALDTRSGRPHWSRGWRVAAQAERFGYPPSDGGLLFHGAAASPGFTRATLEGESGISLMRDPRTLRLVVRVVDTRPFDESRPPTIVDEVRLGGGEGLGGFASGRFHGSDLALARLAYIFPLGQFSEIEMSTERGGVFPNVWRGARLDQSEQSYGVALRVRTERAPLGAVRVNWSHEAVRLGLSVGGIE